MRKVHPRYLNVTRGALTALLLVGMTSIARADFFQGFEHSGLFDFRNGVIHTSPSGSTAETDYAVGINASSGDFLARLSVQPAANVDGGGDSTCTPGSQSCVGPFTTWGIAYDAVTPLSGVPVENGGSVTAVDIYLDVSFAAANPDYQFDWDSALSDSTGAFLQDYIFNAGTGNPSQPVACAPASGGYFVIAASTNSARGSAFPQDPSKSPQCIAKSGWYTFQHVFHSDNNHNLEVDMIITNSHNQVVASWVIHPACMAPQSPGLCANAAPLPFSAVGANAYG